MGLKLMEARGRLRRLEAELTHEMREQTTDEAHHAYAARLRDVARAFDAINAGADYRLWRELVDVAEREGLSVEGALHIIDLISDGTDDDLVSTS